MYVILLYFTYDIIGSYIHYTQTRRVVGFHGLMCKLVNAQTRFGRRRRRRWIPIYYYYYYIGVLQYGTCSGWTYPPPSPCQRRLRCVMAPVYTSPTMTIRDYTIYIYMYYTVVVYDNIRAKTILYNLYTRIIMAAPKQKDINHITKFRRRPYRRRCECACERLSRRGHGPAVSGILMSTSAEPLAFSTIRLVHQPCT